MIGTQVDELLRKAEKYALQGQMYCEEARCYGWCVKKKGLLTLAAAAFKNAAEVMAFVDEMR